MKSFVRILVVLFISLVIATPKAFSDTCTACLPPAQSNTNPGGGNPDDTFAVDSGFFREGISPLNSDPSVVTFQNGFAEEFRNVAEAYKKVEVKTDAASTALQLINSTPLLVIPSGGLYGYENSAIFQATLDEYVKQGGTLIVLSQKHGYDYASVPTPDGKPITGYGWEEDQNCFADSVAIETWHQLLSGQSRSTPTLNVDGYFTGYPANSTVLLRRTANGQPAMLMYDHGAGRVIVTSMYSDWAFGHGQASQEEIALIRDMLSWAKKPAALPEIKPGDTVSLPVTLSNTTATDAVSIKLQIWNPDRSTLLSEQTITLAVPAGQAIVNSVDWQAAANAALGIYHIDYLLFDASGAIIQPQAETDSGRFVVSSPPQTGTIKKDIWLSITSPNQEVFFGEPFAYTFHIFNNSAVNRNLTLKTMLPHTGRTHEWPLTAVANGETTINGSDLFIDGNMFETLRANLYDENNVEIGSYMLSFKGVFPQVAVSSATAKPLYSRGETVDLSVSLRNRRSLATTVKLKVTVTDPVNSIFFSSTADVILPSSGGDSRSFSFLLPQTALGGIYTVSSEVLDVSGKKIGGDSAAFEIPLRLVTLVPSFPSGWQAGVNPFSFNLTNLGIMPVTTGLLGVALADPDNAAVASVSQPFTLDAGETKNLDLSLAIPPLKFGAYTLVYNQGDDAGPGRTSSVPLANSVLIAANFDKPSYRIRETANLALTLSNSGKFNLAGLSVGVAVPDAGYNAIETVNLAANQSILLSKLLPIPETVSAGQHAVIVTLTLQGGSVITKSFTIMVPESLLSLSVSQSSVTAGSTITAKLVNSGGKDTSAEYRLTIYDAKASQLVDQSSTGSALAGGALAVSLPIPLGVADGNYTLVANYRDTITGLAATEQKLLIVYGVKGTLFLHSDKPAYLATENITALSSITNSHTVLQGGNLHLQVSTAVGSNKQKTWTNKSDFQQGVRDGVDTYGVNDWLIPDDDFNGTALDPDKWAYFTNSRIQSGTLLVDGSTSWAGAGPTWSLTGDFDVQVDFSNSTKLQFSLYYAVNGVTKMWFYLINSISSGNLAGCSVNGSSCGQAASGSYSQTGTYRFVRSGSTLTSYYLSGGSWKQLLTQTRAEFANDLRIELSVSPPAKTAIDNFKVSSGSITTKNQTVDSVRLLRLNDNFDDGVLNNDRWSVRGSGSGATNEINGSLVTTDTQTGVKSYANAVGRFQLEGDFDSSIDWKTPVAPATGEWSSIFQISEVDQNTAHDNNLIGNALQIRRAYINGLGHIYQTGHYNGTAWDSWSGPVTTTDTTGKFRIKRAGSSVTVWYWNSSLNRWEWNDNTEGYTWSNAWTTSSYVQIGAENNLPNSPAVETGWNNFKVGSSATYAAKGTIRLKQDAGQTSNWQTISWNATQPIGTSIKLRTRTAETDTALSTALWSDYLSASGSAIASPKGRWLEVEAALATTDTTITPLLNEVTVTYGNSAGDILWQTDVPANLAQGATGDLSNTIGALDNAGKYYLQGSLISSTGQRIATAEYPFFVAKGNTLLSFISDKRLYKPGETVNVSGIVKNLATVEATNIVLVLKEKPAGSAEQIIYTEAFSIAAGGSHPFAIMTTAGTEGTVNLTGTVIQNGSPLAEIADQYEVADPIVTAVLKAPDVAGNDPFDITLSLANSGKTDALVTILPSITSLPENVTILAGQTNLLLYSRQICADTTDTITIAGDLTQTITKTFKYGPALELDVAPQAIYPEGKISLPVTVTNSGLLDNLFTIDYQLTHGANSTNQQAKGYFLTKGAYTADILSFDLAEGSYQFTATSQKPAASATATFQVRKETKADLTLTVGAEIGSLLPATVNVANLGYDPIEGSVRVSLVAENGTESWIAVQDTSLPQSLLPAPRALAFFINLAALNPGNYTVKAELLDGGNRQLAFQALPFRLLGPTIAITQLPQYRTIPSGGSSDFTFKVKNSGNQEGEFDFSFKADDLVSATRSEWLKPGEEKEITFALQTADDLDEKNYFASYSLRMPGSVNSEQGTVKYHLAGLNLAVTAALDRQAYNPGDTAILTLTVTQQETGTAPNLFARVNYNGYNDKQAFTLNSSQTLTFNLPINQITGEKLFYGIYAESGRSIHLNTIYLRKADAELAVSTNKQVYNPGETVTVVTSGSLTGDLTLTGPGDFSTTFAYSGADTRSFQLPATMTAGTYTVKAQLKTQNPELITVAYPFDVAGIQVKVKEALLDSAKYAASDTMALTLAIESNLDIPVNVKTWVVDPAGTYSEAGSGDLTLTASAPLLSTLNSQLATTSLGIHKLVYGIYKGDLLLASGAKAFDIGEAVLLGLAVDRSDYPESSLPVYVKADLYGTVAAGIELFLDGTSIKSDSLNLTGPGSYEFTILPAIVSPGLHNLKAVLNVGGLTSSREIRFTYASSLPDLTARIASQPPGGGTVNLSLTLSNQGNTAAAASRAALYDGDPANGGQLLTFLDVPSIAAGSSVTLSHAWNVLGKSGDHIIYARVDSDNSVVEFIEGNNTSLTALSLPSLSLAVTTGKGAYGANEDAGITVSLANLSANLGFDNATLRLRLTSATGATIDLPDRAAGTIAPATVITLADTWNTGVIAPSSYTITAWLVSGGDELVLATVAFDIVPTLSMTGIITPVESEVPQETSLNALFTLSNNGNIPVDGVLHGIIRDPQSEITKVLQEIPLQLPIAGTKAGTFSFPVTGLPIKGYDLLLRFVSATGEIDIRKAQFTIKDTILPVLTVSTLSNGSYTNNETLNVSGTAQDNSGSVKVEINGVPATVTADNSFSFPLVLRPGANPVEVKAVDPADNQTTDSRTITLDQQAPLLVISTPSDNSKTAISPVEVKGSVDETSTVTVKVKDNVQFAAINGTEFSATVLPLPGWNTIEITALDLADNPSSQKRSVLFDDQKPSLAITEPSQDIRTNKGSLTISGITADTYTAVGVTVTVDEAILTPAVIGGLFSQVVTFTDEKLYPITVIATNEVGTQTTVQRNVIYDKTPPNLTIDPVVTPTNVSNQIVTGTREEGTMVTITCVTATIGAPEYPTSTTWQAALAGMQQGENRLQASATDLAGNRTTAIATVLYVPRAPDVTISTSQNLLWPPNKELVSVTISGNVVTYGSDIKETTVSVADEYGKQNQQGLRFGDTVLLEAWREGNDLDGRVYTITAVVTDQAGNRTTRSTTVVVPHDMGK